MKFKSTRASGGSESATVGFGEAAMMGWAQDGGMLLPERLPLLSRATLRSWAGLSYPDLCVELLSRFTEGEVSREDWQGITDRAFSRFGIPEVVRLRELSATPGGAFVCELWHGPTLAFKDLGLLLLGELLQLLLARADRRTTLLVGTSGDTGSAAIEAFAGLDRVKIVVLYPHGKGRISRSQEQQMAVPAAAHDNVVLVGVDGTSDDLDVPLEAVFRDREFRARHDLNSVNSVNVVRVLSQTVHFFWAYLQLRPAADGRVAFAVPTGAAGHVTAGLMAAQMGLPVDLTAATNHNDVLHEFVREGALRRREAVRVTASPSMDIQVPYNIERVLSLLTGGNGRRVAGWMADLATAGVLRVDPERHARVRAALASAAATDAEIEAAMATEHAAGGYVLDPHTAVGVAAGVAQRPLVCMGCAHPAKFPDTVSRALGVPRERVWQVPGMLEAGHCCVAAVAALDSAERVPPTAVWAQDEDWEAQLRALIVGPGSGSVSGPVSGPVSGSVSVPVSVPVSRL